MAKKKRRLDRDQVKRWREGWSTRDRAMVLAAVDAVPDAVCIEAAARTQFTVYADGGGTRQRALEVMPGLIRWQNRWAQDLDEEVFPALRVFSKITVQHLSIYEPNDALRGAAREAPDFCPTCFQQLPATGRCDTCG